MNFIHKKNVDEIAAPGLRPYWLGLLLVMVLTVFAASSHATNADFVWINSYLDPAMGNSYGIKGAPSPSNHPGARLGSACWKTPDGKFWMFGGYEYEITGSGFKNDLWSYDPETGMWTWISGDNASFKSAQNAIIADVNRPTAREFPSTWISQDGSLWLFGGLGISPDPEYGGVGNLNDLWKFDSKSNQWTLIEGFAGPAQHGVYGNKGVESPTNMPGARQAAASWTGKDGTFWLFGGEGSGNSSIGFLNDLWKFDPSSEQWVWISGSNEGSGGNFGIYGSKGVPAADNSPGACMRASSWIGKDGKLWLFGGFSGYDLGGGFNNNLWQFDPVSNMWTWYAGAGSPSSFAIADIHGNDGVFDSSFTPGNSELTATWTDADGILWAYSGDYWKFDPTLKQWAWIKGSNSSDAEYGTKGISARENTPGKPYGCASWLSNDGQLWLFGGSQNVNALWKLDPAALFWTWIGGSQFAPTRGVYGTRGLVTRQSNPPARSFPATWTAADGSLWLFGGELSGGLRSSRLNDLWKFDTNSKTWGWMGGSNLPDQPGNYGTVGVAGIDNSPGAREGASTWRGSDGSLWMFGGYSSGYLNDMWKYDLSSNQWVWVAGSSSLNQPGIYGILGKPDPRNNPGNRRGAFTWTDSNGVLWMFGGFGYAGSNLEYMNDLWAFDTESGQWTAYAPNLANFYGTKGVASPQNIPGPRYNGTAWLGRDGHLWLFGGDGCAGAFNSDHGPLNDLWNYNISTHQWTWIAGSDQSRQPDHYGEKGIYNAENGPGGRIGPISWTGLDGNLWLFGGLEYLHSQSGVYNDLWCFNPEIGQWKWVKGSEQPNQGYRIDDSIISAPMNIPESRFSGAAWTGNSGDFWLFGSDDSNDLWEIRMRFTSAVDDWQKLWGSMN